MTDEHKKKIGKAIKEKHTQATCICCRKHLKKIDAMKMTHETLKPRWKITMWLCAACKFTADYDKALLDGFDNLVKRRREIACD